MNAMMHKTSNQHFAAASLYLLILEDDESHVNLIRDAFEMADVNVELHVVRTLWEYRASIAERRPDLALVDLKLPDGRGVEVLTAPSEAAPFPVVIITAYGSQEIAVAAMKAGAMDYVVKSSAAFATLPSTVTHALREWNLLRENRRAESVLQLSEERYRSLFNNMLNGFAYCRMIFKEDRPQDFIYLAVNSAFETLTGLKNVVGKRVTEVIPGIRETDPKMFEIYGRVARTGKPETIEIFVEALKMWFSISVYCPAPDNFVAVFDVITARKQTEEALQASEKKFRSMYAAMVEGVALHELVCDVAGKPIDYVLLDVNPAFESILGLDRQAVIGRRASAVYGIGLAPYLDIYAAVAITGRPTSFETAYEPLKKAFAISVFSPTKGCFATVFEDITARKQAENQIRIAKEEWERTFDAVPDLICILDNKHTILRANRAMATKLGVTTEQAVGLTCYQCVHGLQSPPDSCPHTKMLLDLQEHTIEVHEDRLGGDYLVTCTPLRDNAGQLLGSVHVARDITASKQAAIHSNQLAAIVQSSEDCIIGKDINGIITSWNPGAEKMFGYTASEMIGTSITRLIPAGRAGEEERILEQIKRGKSVDHFETLRQAKNGNLIEVSVTLSPIRDVAGKIVGVSKVARDITERKRVEEQLRQSSAKLQEAQRVAQIGSWEWDIPTNTIKWSEELYRVFSIDPKKSLTNYVGHLDLYMPASRDRLDAAVQTTMRTGAGYNLDLELANQTGATKWVQVRGESQRDANGRICGLRGTTQDVTARKQAEQLLLDSNEQLDATLTELRQTQRQIVAQENLRVLGQMASGIAHDFNNALAPIIGFSELLMKHPEKLEDQEQVLKRLQIINTCATDAARVVRQMREFGRQGTDSHVFQPVDLNKLVRQTVDHTKQHWKDQAQAVGKTIEIATDLLPVSSVSGEEFAIRELLTNLIFNAVDAMPEGGTITLGTMMDGNSVRLSVRDTGTGMSEEVQRRCLEPFFTTKGTGGTGLGLAMVQGIVQRHNGTVDIESKLGHGTTFIIRLPIQHAGKAPTAPAQVSAVSQSLHVLVVDVEPLLCAITEAFLMDDGHTVETVNRGAAALERLKTGQFAVVITDRAMPEMNGDQLAVAIHQSVPGLPVILMTGFGDIMHSANEMPPHINTILSKPLTQASLRAALTKVLPQFTGTALN